MLDRQHRLTSPADFAAATRRGRRAGTRTLVVHLTDGSATDPFDGRPPLVGLVVGRSVGNAVRRNRVKRRLRHLARDRVALLPVQALMVVRALPGAADATYDALGRDLDLALGRLGCPGPGADTTTTGRPRTGVSR